MYQMVQSEFHPFAPAVDFFRCQSPRRRAEVRVARPHERGEQETGPRARPDNALDADKCLLRALLADFGALFVLPASPPPEARIWLPSNRIRAFFVLIVFAHIQPYRNIVSYNLHIQIHQINI